MQIVSLKRHCVPSHFQTGGNKINKNAYWMLYVHFVIKNVHGYDKPVMTLVGFVASSAFGVFFH